MKNKKNTLGKSNLKFSKSTLFELNKQSLQQINGGIALCGGDPTATKPQSSYICKMTDL